MWFSVYMMFFSITGDERWRKEMKACSFWRKQLYYIHQGWFVTTLNRAGRLTGRQIYNIHKVQPLRRYQWLSCTFYSCQRNLRWEKKYNKMNSRGKINSRWILSLLSNIKHCKLFNVTTLMSQRTQDPAGADICRRWPKGKKESESTSQKQTWWKRHRCLSVNR